MTHVQLSLHDLSQLVIMQTQSGKGRNEIINILVARGWPEASATRFVDMTLSEHEELASQTRSHTQAENPEQDQQPGNEAFPNEQELWRMLFIVALAVAIIVMFSLLNH
jgi:hypothetical protein